VIEEFWATAVAQRHMMAKHRVDLDDALCAAESTDRHYRTDAGPDGERRYIVPGKAGDGARLWVIYADEGDGRGRIITARRADGRSEQARHRRLRGD
jgi:uncharacterized DUF497 family protein